MTLVATLIANPRTPVLEERFVNGVANAVNCRNVYWLADGVACDLVFASQPDPTIIDHQIRNLIGPKPVDLVVQQQEQRRKKALIADMDSTMIQQECIDELAAEAGIKDEVSKITARAMNGEIPFAPALRERVMLLKGLPVSVVDTVINNRITLTPGGKTLIATMKANGAFTALVSGGFSQFTAIISAKLGFSENRANLLEEQSGLLTGRVVEPILGREAKVEALSNYARSNNLQPSDFLAVGDGANDLGMLEAAGCGVALHAKPAVAAQADTRIDYADLTALLYLQGYRKSEFVT